MSDLEIISPKNRHIFSLNNNFKLELFLTTSPPDILKHNDTGTVIYILCYNDATLNSAKERYYKYKWALPILIKNNTYEFENSFWSQMLEYYDNWKNADMVGTLSHSAYKKIDLDLVDKIITNKLYLPNSYFHFFDTNNPIPTIETETHPHFNIIWNDVLSKLNLFNTTESLCNYWMCKPSLMVNFINWYINECKPTLLNHKLMFEDSQYKGKLSQSQLMKMWGKPYYPYYTFIVERLNKCFFTKKHKIVFFISNGKQLTRETNMLKESYDSHNVKNVSINMSDFKNVDIVSYIKETSCELSCSPIVICDSLQSWESIEQLSKTTITTYWVISEHYDRGNVYNKHCLHLFNTDTTIVFKSIDQYNEYLKLAEINKYILLTDDNLVSSALTMLSIPPRVSNNNLHIKMNDRKILTIIACHTDSYIKIKALLHNLKYFMELSSTIYIINSAEFKYLNIDGEIKNVYKNKNIIINDVLSDELCYIYKNKYYDLYELTNDQLRQHWKTYAIKEKRSLTVASINIYIDYIPNDKFVCHGKWIYCLNKIDYAIYKNVILTNDSFIINRSLTDFKSLINPATEMVALLESLQIKRHYPDFLLAYNIRGIRKILKYYEENKHLISDFQSVIENYEVNNSTIFNNVEVLYKNPSGFIGNVHFDDTYVKEYLYNKNYPIVKIKKAVLNDEFVVNFLKLIGFYY